MDTRQFLRDIDDHELALRGLASYVMTWFEQLPTAMEYVDEIPHANTGGARAAAVIMIRHDLNSMHKQMALVLKDLADRELRLRDAAVGLSHVKIDEEGPERDPRADREGGSESPSAS